MVLRSFYNLILFFIVFHATGQHDKGLWHGKERTMHYRPYGNAFLKVWGAMRFNRALYGGNTGFRVEAGDLPEFAMYLPGMGGNFKLGFIAGNNGKWITEAKHIRTMYRAGEMHYELRDPMLGSGTLYLQVVALDSTEGMVIRAQFVDVHEPMQLCWAYGGVTGKRFSRDGDIGADPESVFYMQPEYCKGNSIAIKENRFALSFGANGERKIWGLMPASSSMHVGDATQQNSPLALLRSRASETPVITGALTVTNTVYYFLVQPKSLSAETGSFSNLFSKPFTHEASQPAQTPVAIHTPDPYINGLGEALYEAGDAIYEHPSYLHGAVAWRMRLPAWRGAYVADPLGWHDRARAHFSSYALSQVKEPESAPVVMDTALNLARHLEKIGTGMFTSGYICRNPNGDIRPHHYDMNLVFIDQLLTHFYWTGDTAYVREMWPLLERHIAWEKRNFDADGDGLYDAYCCIWASDALQYTGGGVTHSSAYNYRANKTIATLAEIIGKDATPYRAEAEKIFRAVQAQLWLPALGRYAEYKDLLGRQQVHPVPGLWTIYHALDAKLPDNFQSFQALRYIDTEIPHIPVKALGLEEDGLYLLSTSDWQPYTWSVNNVALAENLHAALAYWQGNRPEEAFRLWKSALVESMYLGASPGGFQQLSFYDAIRGQLYRDFADPVGMAARSLVEGLFGIMPNLLHDTLTIRPGFPATWEFAHLRIPDVEIDYSRKKDRDHFRIISRFPKSLHTKLQVRARKTGIHSVRVNGKNVAWRMLPDAVGAPMIEMVTEKMEECDVEIEWKGKEHGKLVAREQYALGQSLRIAAKDLTIDSIYDPQQVLQSAQVIGNTLWGMVMGTTGEKTLFVQVRQGAFKWWQPLCFRVSKPVEIVCLANAGDELTFSLKSHAMPLHGIVTVNPGPYAFTAKMQVAADSLSQPITVPAKHLKPGSNRLVVEDSNGLLHHVDVLNWNVPVAAGTKYEKVPLAPYFNDAVTNIFKHRYLSPRPASPTLQLPVQGIGNWCYPLTTANINDSGLRAMAAAGANEIRLPQGIPFATPGDTGQHNIVFTSQWDNFPDSVTIPLSGQAMHAYFMMAGSTNPMQSRLVNGAVRVQYADGSSDTLSLYNPTNWWPIEQDYLEDGYAFTTGNYKPLRFYLKKGVASSSWDDYTTIKGFSNRAIDGGAATILDLPLDPHKSLQSITVHALANDVVIGLMGVTLER